MPLDELPHVPTKVDKIFIRVCAKCKEVLDNCGFEIETEEEALALRLAGMVEVTHGYCMTCAIEALIDAGETREEAEEILK